MTSKTKLISIVRALRNMHRALDVYRVSLARYESVEDFIMVDKLDTNIQYVCSLVAKLNRERDEHIKALRNKGVNVNDIVDKEDTTKYVLEFIG